MLLLAKRGIDISSTSPTGLNALHLAAAKNYPDIIKLLISYDFPLNEVTQQGLTALSIAVFKKHHVCVEALLEAKEIEVEKRTREEGMTCLQMALKLRDKESVRMLVDRGACVYYEDPEKKPLSPVLFMLKNQLITALEQVVRK